MRLGVEGDEAERWGGGGCGGGGVFFGGGGGGGRRTVWKGLFRSGLFPNSSNMICLKERGESKD